MTQDQSALQPTFNVLLMVIASQKVIFVILRKIARMVAMKKDVVSLIHINQNLNIFFQTIQVLMFMLQLANI